MSYLLPEGLALHNKSGSLLLLLTTIPSHGTNMVWYLP